VLTGWSALVGLALRVPVHAHWRCRLPEGRRERAQAAGRPNATAPTGILRLGLSGSGRDGYVFVPSSYQASAPSALVVALHGAGKGGLDGLGVLVDQANSSGALCTGPPASQ